MSKRNCAPGTKWDSLLQTCIYAPGPPRPPTHTELALTSLVELKNTSSTDQTVAAFNPALWIMVLLATLGSILALALWIVIYRRHTRRQHRTAEDKAAEQPLQNTEPLVTVHSLLPSERNGHAKRDGGASPQCQHLHTRIQTAPMWEEGGGACREHTKHEEKNWGRGLKGSAVRQETVPLPATELGGTALVTTKTL